MSNETRAAIRPVKNRVEDDLLARPGVTGVDIAQKVSDGQPTGELSIVVFVDKKVPVSRLSKADLIPKEIDGVLTDVQEVTFELQSPVWEPVDAVALIDTTAYPTLVGGISMGPSRTFYLTPPEVPTAGNYTIVGTLGALVRDNATGATMGLTNFHVGAVDTSWAAGQRMTQPGRPDGGNPSTQEFGALARAVLSEHVDGALITVDNGRAWQATVQGIGGVTGTAAAVLNQHVRKRGRTTELTDGTVQSLDFTVSINYGDGLGTRTLRNQIRIDPVNAAVRFSDHGDSGSVIMNDNREVVGLLYGGATNGSMTFANPIADVLSELNVTMLIDQVVTVPTLGIACRPTLVTCPPSRLICPTLPNFCRPTLATCPSLIRICPTAGVVCRPSLVCPSRGIPCVTAATCPTLACPTLACPSLAGCPSLACGFGPQFPGAVQSAGDVDYGYGEPDPTQVATGSYETGFTDGYQAGYADGQAGGQAAQELGAGVQPPELMFPTGNSLCPPNTTRTCPTWAVCPSIQVCPTRLQCPSIQDCPTRLQCPSIQDCPTRLQCPSIQVCPSRFACPSRFDCPSRITCPSDFVCPSTVACPSRFDCPTRLGCPSLAVCPSLRCPSGAFCGPINPGGPVEAGSIVGESDQSVVDSAYWAGYLAALEQYGGDAQQ